MTKSKMQLMRFTLIFTSAIAFLLAAPSARSSEPGYNGKPLSEWLLILKEGHTLAGERVEAADAEEAVRQIGTNGIPTLIDLLGVKERTVKKVLSKLHNKDLRYYYTMEENRDSSLESLRELGVGGFSVLGTNAEFAVPQIAKVFYSYDEPTFQAARALSKVGPKGFSVLTNAISDTNAGVRDVVIRVIGKAGGGDPQMFRQLLVNALKDPNILIRLHAADFLRGKDLDLVIAALLPLLGDSKYGQRAANVLAAYGPAAKSAAPELLSVFTNGNMNMNILNALRKIDPDTAAKAEDFLVNSGPLNGARFGYTRTKLTNGMELIAGGYIHTEIPTVKNRDLSSAELLDPKTGKWIETGEMNTTRDGHTAILLHSGKVLVAGGYDPQHHALSSAELYDPTTGKWTLTDSMNGGHSVDHMTLQSDGRILIFSGDLNSGKKYNQELYNPATGTWSVISKQ